MQMTIVVTTGYILADTPIVQKGLTKLSKLANTPSQAIILVTLVASIASWINYGFGLVVGALIATYVARRVPSVNLDRKSTRLNSSHVAISYAVCCLKKKNNSMSLIQ